MISSLRVLKQNYNLLHSSKHFISKMPDNVVPQHLLQNVKESFDLIAHVKEEIKQMTSILYQKAEAIKISKLKEENQKLTEQIAQVKDELINLQIANGVPQIPVPGDETKTISQPIKKTETSKVLPESTPQENTDAPVKDKKSAKPPKVKKQAAPAAEEQSVDVGKLDIRVGKITNVKIHPDADQLYVEQIDVGEDKCRTVISGLVKHIPLAELDQRMVLVLCNLKPVKMRGIMSEAMVMCASTPDKVEVLSPPSSALPGDKVVVPGFTYNPDLPFMNPKKKIFEQVAEDLKVDSEKRASYKNVPWKIDNKDGDVTSQTLVGCCIK